MNTLSRRNNKILDSQFNTVIEDANEDKKWAAVNNMKLVYEREQKEQEELNRLKAEEKRLELKETQRILQLQMANKSLKKVANQEGDKQFWNFLDETISVLGNWEKEELDKRSKLRDDYKKDL